MHKFTQHRDAISSLKFRKKSFDLYTASFDRCIKCFNVEELGYRETLFGHQDRVATIDTLDTERALSCGMRDKTVRIFKIVEESQLVFMSGGGHKYDSDAVVMEEMGNFMVIIGQTEKKKVKDQGKSGGSIDSCCYIDQEYFLSGSDSGYK